MKSDYQQNGFFLLQSVLPKTEIPRLIQALKPLTEEINPYGVRDLMRKLPDIQSLATSEIFLYIAKHILGENAKPVRSVFFDKIPQANWNVAWHQDTSIAVSEKAELPGFRLWTEKQGVIHVEPPVIYLANILTLRLHLDAATSENGVLRVIPQSHKYGRIKSQQLLELVEKSQPVECIAEAGDILLMNPLLLHSSRKSITALHRRIIHLEYCALDLPVPLNWYEDTR
jgi:ectoine hydroxylase-related dioxygenase (phytanoyl-CoA dioxygenase family)